MHGIGARMLIAACLVTCAGIAAAAGSQGDAFLNDAIEGNLGEVKIGALAQQKGMSEDVKNFGAMLEKDHAAANQKATAAAKAMGMDAPKEPGPEQKKMYEKLSGLSGKEFDQRFIKEMVEDHEKDIKKYSTAAGKDEGQASGYARQILPDLRKHLATAQRIQASESPQQQSSANR